MVVLVVLLLVVVVVGVVVVGTVPVGVVMGILSSSSVVVECVVEGLAEDLRVSSSKPSGGSGIRFSQSWSLPP